MSAIDIYPQFLELVKTRFSCRKYTSESVSHDLIKAVIEAAQLAPSAKNLQPWHFYVAETPEQLSAVAECYNRDWIKTAPVCLIACGDHDRAWHRDDGKDSTDIDIAIAVEHITLAATSLGLATCWVCNFDAEMMKKLLSLPDSREPIAIIPLGYADDSMPIPEKKRKSLDEIITWGKA